MADDVQARVARLSRALDARRREPPKPPVRRHPLVRWLRSPLLGRPKRTGTPSPFEQGLADGRREGWEQGFLEGRQSGLAEGYARGFSDGASAGAQEG